jgi:hypothetical protein
MKEKLENLKLHGKRSLINGSLLAFFFFADRADLTGIVGHALMNHGRGERTDHLPIFYKTMPERI